MKKVLNIVTRGLAAAAASRAKYVTRLVTLASQPVVVDYRSNAGGWK